MLFRSRSWNDSPIITIYHALLRLSTVERGGKVRKICGCSDGRERGDLDALGAIDIGGGCGAVRHGSVCANRARTGGTWIDVSLSGADIGPAGPGLPWPKREKQCVSAGRRRDFYAPGECSCFDSPTALNGDAGKERNAL